MSLRDYGEIVWRRKFVVLVLMAIGLVVASMAGGSEKSVEGAFSGDLTLAMDEGGNFSDLLLFEQVAIRTNTIVNQVAADLEDDFFGAGVDPAQGISAAIDVEADPVVGTIRLLVSEMSSEESAEQLLIAYGDAMMGYATDRQIAGRDEQLASLERREISILARIDELDAELDRLAATQTGSDVDRANDPSRLTTAQLGSNLASLTGVQEEIAVLRDQAEDDLAPLQHIGTPNITDETFETSPLSMNQRMAVGLLLATVLGVGLALGLQRFDARLFSRKDVESAFGLPVLAEIPNIRWWSRRRPMLYTRAHPTSRVAVAYRLLRSGLVHARASQVERLGRRDDGRGPVVLVTSVTAQVGKTTTVSNLAVAAVDAGMSVLVVGADLRDPKIHEYFDVDPAVGITEAIRGQLRTGQSILDPFIVPTGAAGITMLAQGEWVPNPGELLAQLRPLLELAAQQFDLILVDTPPMLDGNDVSELIPFADLVLLVARSGRTTIDEAQWVEETAARLEAPLCGVLLIGSRQSLESRRESLLRRLARKVLYLVLPSRRSRRPQRVTSGGAAPTQDGFVQPGLFDAPVIRRPPSEFGSKTTQPDQTRPPTSRVAAPGEETNPVVTEAAPAAQSASPLASALLSNGHVPTSAAVGGAPAQPPTPHRAIDHFAEADETVVVAEAPLAPGQPIALPAAEPADPATGVANLTEGHEPVAGDRTDGNVASEAVPAMGEWATMTVELSGLPLPTGPSSKERVDGDAGIDLDAGLIDEEQPAPNGTGQQYPPPQSMSA